MILVEDVTGLGTRSNRSSPFQHLQARRRKTPKRDIISILVPGLGKAENVRQSVEQRSTPTGMREEVVEDGGTEAGSASGLTIRTRGGRLPVITGTEPSADEVSTYERRARTQCRPAR